MLHIISPPCAILAVLITSLVTVAAKSVSITNCSSPSVVTNNDLGFPAATFIGTIAHLNQHGPDNRSDPLIVTRYKNGTALPYNDWVFWACSNLRNHAYPPGYNPDQGVGGGPVNYAFGIMHPATADGNLAENCLALAGTDDGTAGATLRLVLARNCSAVPVRYRTFMIADYIYDDGLSEVYYANGNTTWVVQDDPHGVVTLVVDYEGSGGQALEFEVAEEN